MLVIESPTMTIPITEPIPMMMPSMVSSARILFARSPEMANEIFSKSCVIDSVPPA